MKKQLERLFDWIATHCAGLSQPEQESPKSPAMYFIANDGMYVDWGDGPKRVPEVRVEWREQGEIEEGTK